MKIKFSKNLILAMTALALFSFASCGEKEEAASEAPTMEAPAAEAPATPPPAESPSTAPTTESSGGGKDSLTITGSAAPVSTSTATK